MNQIQELSAAYSKLAHGDQVFAHSLLKQVASGRGLSDKQMYWVGELVKRATQPPEPKVEVVVGDFGEVIALFAQASKHLKHPAIDLALPDGSPIHLTVAGKLSKAPGSVNVTDGKPFGQNKWYGRVAPDGTWEPGRAVTPEAMTALGTLLTRLSHAPHRVAAAHGKLTGRCCFCNSKLSDPKSTEVGYGPQCAKSFGMPWGAK